MEDSREAGVCLGQVGAGGHSDDVADLLPIQCKGAGDMQAEVSRQAGFLGEEEPGDGYLGGSEPRQGLGSCMESVCRRKHSKLRRDLEHTST